LFLTGTRIRDAIEHVKEILPAGDIYRRGSYDVRHNGEKGGSDGIVRVFSAGSFFLTKGYIAVL